MYICPDCLHPLIEVSFDSEKAGKVHCLYCSFCGGSFFEHWDINLLSLEDIKKELSRLFKQQGEVPASKANPKCPVCQNSMEVLHHEAIPQNVHVFACPSCHGNWFPKGELVKFKEEQTSKLASLKKLNIPLASIYSLFLPVFFLAMVFGMTYYFRQSAQNGTLFTIQTRASTYQKMLQIKKISETSVEISFFTDEPTKSIVYYRSENEILNKQENDYSRYHYTVIDNLLNPTAYLFQIRSETPSGKAYNSDWLTAK